MRRRQFVSGAAALAAAPVIALPGRPAVAGARQAGSSSLSGIGERLSGLIPELAGQLGSPGYVAGIYQDGSEWMYAHGVRNLNTGDPMTTDTAWLLGSITKVLTTTLLLKYVEAGRIDLEAPVGPLSARPQACRAGGRGAHPGEAARQPHQRHRCGHAHAGP